MISSESDFLQILDRAFEQYLTTCNLLDEWLNEKKNIQEFVILACARLDSLSNLAFSEGAQERNFVKFLSTYSNSRKELTKVSLPDLYWYLLWFRESLPGTIQKPGRLYILEPRRDRDLISLIWNSDVAITERDIGHLIGFFCRQLKKYYRVSPYQSKMKQTSDKEKSVRDCLESAAKSYKTNPYGKAVDAIGPILSKFTLASLLYREYRCGAIHAYKVYLDTEEFFSKKTPYWSIVHHLWIEESAFLNLLFPGPFLVRVLNDCVHNYKAHLASVEKLPAGIFFEFCHFPEDLEYLDETSIPNGKDVSINI